MGGEGRGGVGVRARARARARARIEIRCGMYVRGIVGDKEGFSRKLAED